MVKEILKKDYLLSKSELASNTEALRQEFFHMLNSSQLFKEALAKTYPRMDSIRTSPRDVNVNFSLQGFKVTVQSGPFCGGWRFNISKEVMPEPQLESYRDPLGYKLELGPEYVFLENKEAEIAYSRICLSGLRHESYKNTQSALEKTREFAENLRAEIKLAGLLNF